MPDEEEKKSPFSNPIVLGLVGAVVVLLAVMGWLLTRGTGEAACVRARVSSSSNRVLRERR